MKNGLEPIINKDSDILILGSLPGELSLKNQKYYDNKTNHFWKLLSYIFEDKFVEFNKYEEKMMFLKKYKVALWDVIKCANREGSLDSNIKNEEYNDLYTLIKKYNISNIYVNGRKAESSLKKYLKINNIKLNYNYLPSSSSLNAKITLIEKAEIWKSIIKEI